jgi:hypothetical protein
MVHVAVWFLVNPQHSTWAPGRNFQVPHYAASSLLIRARFPGHGSDNPVAWFHSNSCNTMARIHKPSQIMHPEMGEITTIPNIRFVIGLTTLGCIKPYQTRSTKTSTFSTCEETPKPSGPGETASRHSHAGRWLLASQLTPDSGGWAWKIRNNIITLSTQHEVCFQVHLALELIFFLTEMHIIHWENE